MITVTVNGEDKQIATETLLSDALENWDYTGQYFSVAINNDFISRQEYQNTVLKQDDEILIVTPMQGG